VFKLNIQYKFLENGLLSKGHGQYKCGEHHAAFSNLYAAIRTKNLNTIQNAMEGLTCDVLIELLAVEKGGLLYVLYSLLNINVTYSAIREDYIDLLKFISSKTGEVWLFAEYLNVRVVGMHREHFQVSIEMQKDTQDTLPDGRYSTRRNKGN
jgi:hypothetical protein